MARHRISCPLVFLASLAPALTAIWWHPGFVTQDGPAHLYNAQILTRAFDPESPFRKFYEVRWEPLPNWAGHLAAMGLVSTLPTRIADRAMTTLTLVAFAASIVWLRYQVAGRDGLIFATILAVSLGLNVTWLLGFTSFLLGSSLYAITLATWWSRRREGFSWRRGLTFAALMALGYFCHLISLGLTAIGLIVLELFTPSMKHRGRAATTALGLLPLIPLGLTYARLMHRGGGGLDPEWKHLRSVLSLRSWVDQVTWVDPISLARKDYFPLFEFASPWFWLFAPVAWFALGVMMAIVRTGKPDSERRGWVILASVLVLGGLLGPDTLGATHGEYMQQRVVLLGLAALIPALGPYPNRQAGGVRSHSDRSDAVRIRPGITSTILSRVLGATGRTPPVRYDPAARQNAPIVAAVNGERRWSSTTSGTRNWLRNWEVITGLFLRKRAHAPRLPRLFSVDSALDGTMFCVVIIALGLQSLAVWDYGRTSDRTAGTILQAMPAIGENQRVATLLNGIKTPFRANPLLHADCALGIGTGNIIWGNYETRFYYFPVQFQSGLDHPEAIDLEAIALMGDHPSAARTARWEEFLKRHEQAIDVLLIWGSDPTLETINRRWFETASLQGEVTVMTHKGVTSPPSSIEKGSSRDRQP